MDIPLMLLLKREKKCQPLELAKAQRIKREPKSALRYWE